MTDAAKNLIVGLAKAVNPKVKVIVKYPNWYEHFAGMGFNLETEPKIFDGIYTGTETRDAIMSAQHLQPYLGYNIVRYYENIVPGRNGGGWVDPFASNYSDRYTEQLWITLFAKAKEQTLFYFRSITRPSVATGRAAWQEQHTSFDYDEMMQPRNYNGGASTKPTTIARVAGYTIPDNFSDLYNLPAEALNKIRQVLCGNLNIQIEGPSKISLYVYDNNTFIVKSFLDTETIVKAITPQAFNTIIDINTNELIKGELRKPGFSYVEKNLGAKNVYTFTLKPHSFKVFKMQ